MSLPSPNLDDRTWEEIVEAAKRLIPTYCPRWTDFNASDPGITLVELMAWMTEMILYRLNLVPDKNYIKFMDLIGVTLKPPKPAQTWLTFDVTEGAPQEDLKEIPAGTKVSGLNPEGEPVTFETTAPLNPSAARLLKLVARKGEWYNDLTDQLAVTDSSGQRHNVFKSNRIIPHCFYIGDDEFGSVGTDFCLHLNFLFKRPASGVTFEWSFWNGEFWEAIAPSSDETLNLSLDGEILFHHLPKLKECEVNGVRTHWLRVRLVDHLDFFALPTIEAMEKWVVLKRSSGILPDIGFFSSEEIPYIPLVFQGIISPFGLEGKLNDTFYVSSKVFERRDELVDIAVKLADNYTPCDREVLKVLRLSWEYYGESGVWEILGVTSDNGLVGPSRFGLKDDTGAFTRSGKISFRVPHDIAQLQLNGESRFWVRVRIVAGTFSPPPPRTGWNKKIAKLKLSEIMPEDTRNPPICTSIKICFKGTHASPQYYQTYNDFVFRDLSTDGDDGKGVEPFVTSHLREPELYLGFDLAFSQKLHTLYIRLNREGNNYQEIDWEYSTGDGWDPLPLIEDGTRHFTRSGLVQFMGPANWKKTSEFETDAFWLRVRWVDYDMETPPMLRFVHLNAVKGIGAVSHTDVVLGSSNSLPFQQYKIPHPPILDAPVVMVRELDDVIEKEVEAFRKKLEEKVVVEIDDQEDDTRRLWVQWTRVPNFFKSGRNSRHYTLDNYHGIIRFGDGVRGKIPPTGNGNIKVAHYYTGGGVQGNLPEDTLINIDDAFDFIEGVNNPYSSSGGSEMETIEEAKLRAPWELKHRNRAVCAEDFQELAKQASNDVAKAFCYTAKAGEIHMVIVPRPLAGTTDYKPCPSELLKDIVYEYLEERKLITTRLKIRGPKYRGVDIVVAIVLSRKAALQHKGDAVKTLVKERLLNHFHPIYGGREGSGWPMGRDVYLSEAAYVVESIDEVDHITGITFNGESPIFFKIDKGEYPYLKEITVVQQGALDEDVT